jgi:hypothetical protein
MTRMRLIAPHRTASVPWNWISPQVGERCLLADVDCVVRKVEPDGAGGITVWLDPLEVADAVV